LSLKKSQSVAIPLVSADEDTPMKGETDVKEEHPIIDLNETVN
jgi:hypothetical protein